MNRSAAALDPNCPEPIGPGLSYRVLRRFEVRRGDARVEAHEWRRPMAARLVRLLLAHRERPLADDQILEALWPDKDPRAARRCFRVVLSQARGALDRGPGASAIQVVDRTFLLDLAPEDDVDADTFAATALRALRSGGRGELEHASALWTGEPLPEDAYADWALPWRERLRDLHRDLLGHLGDVHEREGDHFAALRMAQRMLEEDPLDEDAHRRAMRAYASHGSRHRACVQYARCRALLVERLGVEPAAETRELRGRLLG